MSGGRQPCVFLSHSGADADAACVLKRRILASPTARKAGLTVWLDKDDLEPGRGWQVQLEEALTERSTAFAVYVGSTGIVNWVEREVRIGLDLATRKGVPFIPIISADATGVSALPPFVQQFQAVRDPLHDEDQLKELIEAVLGRGADIPFVLTDEPFVGLRAMTEQEADRFFGRDKEKLELIARMRRHRLVAIKAESGSGKSSLAQAGLVYEFRGGAFEDTSRLRPDDATWHVVVMKPGSDPMAGLKDAIDTAARAMGMVGEDRSKLRRRVVVADPYEAAHAIRCDLPKESTETLLIVDQFEELLTQTPENQRQQFIEMLLSLTKESGRGFRILLTVRYDYFNLCRPPEETSESDHYGPQRVLYEALTANEQDAVYPLRRISERGLEEAIRRPLSMAGHRDKDAQDILVQLFKRDTMDRPGDLALVQMALFAVWRRHLRYHEDLAAAYAKVGGVPGALAHEADRVRTEILNEDERSRLLAIFVRLIRLGETGGVVRRVARLDEFDRSQCELAKKLATEECARLTLVGEQTVEVAHEALITQWPWLQNALGGKETIANVRRLERLTDDAQGWTSAKPEDKARHLANFADLDQFVELERQHPDWPSPAEREFIAASRTAAERAEFWRKARLLGFVTAAIIVAVAGIQLMASNELAAISRQHAEEAQTRLQDQIEANRLRRAASMQFAIAQDVFSTLSVLCLSPGRSQLAAKAREIGENTAALRNEPPCDRLKNVSRSALLWVGNPDRAAGARDIQHPEWERFERSLMSARQRDVFDSMRQEEITFKLDFIPQIFDSSLPRLRSLVASERVPPLDPDNPFDPADPFAPAD